jgi:hypothetical protein
VIGGHEGHDAIDGFGGNAAAVSQPIGELAVVDGAAAEGRFGQPGMPAEIGNLLKQLLGGHGSRLVSSPADVLVAAASGTEKRSSRIGIRQPQTVPL